MYLPLPGGIVHVIESIVSGLKDKVDQLVLVAAQQFGMGGSSFYQGVQVKRVFSLGNLFSMPLALSYPFHFWVQAKQADIVHFHYPFPLVDLTVALYFPRKTALVVHWHAEITAQKKLARWLGFFTRRCLQRADKIIVSSPDIIAESVWLKPYVDKCQVIPYGINPYYLSQLSSVERMRVSELKQRYPRLVLAVGRLVSYKGFSVLLKAIKETDAQLIIIGEGVLAHTLQRQIEDLGLQERAWLKGRVDDAELKCFYHACRLFAFPSETEAEAFGLVQLEAMLCAKPVVNTKLNSSVPWVARDDKEGITVPPSDDKALAVAIESLLTDSALATRLGNAGFERVNQLFTQEMFLQQIDQLYEELLFKYKKSATTRRLFR